MLIQSDAAQIPLPDKSIHCVTTSPPYWGLRKYSGVEGSGMFPNLGLESTPDEFVHNMVIIFREVRRVLRDDGVVWLNLGDSFAGSGGENLNTGLNNAGSGKDRSHLYRNNPRRTSIAQGNLMMMPHRVAIALQDDGWIIRNDVIWYKRNPMPESVNGRRWSFDSISAQEKRNEERIKNGKSPKPILDGVHHKAPQNVGAELYDAFVAQHGEGGLVTLDEGSFRHTRAHEYVFQLVKQMGYWSNQEAARVKHDDTVWSQKGAIGGNVQATSNPIERSGDIKRGRALTPRKRNYNPAGRNPRSVLDIPTAPYKGAHYATFPPNLIAPLIRATCPRWACPVCGQGWSPVVEKTGGVLGKSWHDHSNDEEDGNSRIDYGSLATGGDKPYQTSVKEYRPTCDHPHTIEEAVPGIVLDPFVGSGTTVQVAKQLLRRGVGLDISMDYLDEQAKIRTGAGSPTNVLDDLPLFSQMELES